MLETFDEHRAAGLQQRAEAYADNAFGVDLAMALLQSSTMPFFIQDRYRLWRSNLLGRPCVLMAPRSDLGREGWSELSRHRAIVCNQLHGELIILLFDALPSRRRKKLIADRMAFMVPGAQLYVPEMLLEVTEGRVTKPPLAQAPEQLSPTAQMVAIGALLGREVEGANATALARRLGVAVMSIIRAFDELQAAGVADARRIGRERTLHLQAEGRDLWRQIEGRLQSPVRKVRRVFIPYPDRFPGLMAGESALANYTALAAPRIQVQAVAGADWNRLVREQALVDHPDYGDGEDIQTWTYDPAVFAERKTVDRLSLYLSVRHHPDERVTQAAEQLLEDMPW